MSDSTSPNLIKAMNSLWFNQNTLLSKPISPHTLKSKHKMEESTTNSSLNHSSSTPLQRSTTLPVLPPIHLKCIDEEHHSYTRSQPCRSSSSINKPTHLRTTVKRRLESSKSLSELEFDELKGFMDLGFVFNKDELSPYVMSVIPGLQRLREKYKEEEDQEESKRVERPYLSEAWLIKRPDSPLINIPSISAVEGSDMKNHLRFWARTVAHAINQEL